MKRIICILCLFSIVISAFSGCVPEKSGVHLGNIVILGDSFSTYIGHVPEGYKCFYTDNGFGGVTSVEHTWWHRVAEMTESEILLNSSYSGSTVSHTGYDGEDYSEFSFAARITELICDGFFEENRVDTLIVYGGLNDCWAGSPRGEIKHEGITDADLYLFYPAFSYVIGSVRTASPDTRIIVVIEEQLDTGMKEGIAEIAAYHGCTAVYPTGAELSGSHPTSRGMRTIAEQIVEALSE